MAVSSSTNKATFTQAGTTTVFSLEVKCFSTDEVKVYTKIDGVQAEVTTGITKAAVSGDLDSGVSVTFDTAPEVGTDIILIREIDETQILELLEGGNLSAGGLEDALDRGVMISQQITERFDRSIQFPVSDEDLSYDVGTAEERANKALGFDADGNVTELDLASSGAIGVNTAKGLVLASNVISAKVDDTTVEFSSGDISVKAGGIGATQMASNAVTTVKILNANVTTAKIADANVTKAKIENVASMRVLGNVTGSPAAPAEVAVLDEDTMSSDSAVSLATQQSIKAYVDASDTDGFTPAAYAGEESVTFPNGLIMKFGIIATASAGQFTITFATAFPTAIISAQCTAQPNATTDDWISQVKALSVSAMVVEANAQGNSPGAGDKTTWFAIGY